MTHSTESHNGLPHAAAKGPGPWDLGRFKPLAPEMLCKEIELYKSSGDIEHRNRIVESHLRLVAKNARRYSGTTASFDDLMLEGTLAIMRALDSFDPARGTCFTSYAACAVEHAVRDAARSASSGILRLPARERRKAAIQYRVETTFYAQHGRAPDASDWNAALPENARGTTRSHMPLARELSLDGTGSAEQAFSITPADGRPGPVEEVSLSEESNHVSRALDELPPAARESVRMRFGLGGQAKLSLAEIGRRLQLSPHAVELTIADALRRLRRLMSSTRLAV